MLGDNNWWSYDCQCCINFCINFGGRMKLSEQIADLCCGCGAIDKQLAINTAKRLEYSEAFNDWRGTLTLGKDNKMPMTEEYFDKVITMRDELVFEQKDEIAKLKSIINKLEHKVDRWRDSYEAIT